MKNKLFTALIFGLFTTSSFAQGLYDESIVRDVKLSFNQSNYWSLLDQNRQSETYLEADLEVDGISYPQVGVRFKGNSSASVWPAEKMPFKIKMDEYVVNQELYGFDTINLGNSFMDPTFCREVVSYHVLREYMPAPRANFVRLSINGSYWGIYSNVEQVSGEFLSEWFADNNGNRYKCDPVTGGGPGGGGNMATLTWLGSTPSSYYNTYQFKSTPNGTEWLDLVDLCNYLNNGSITNLIGDVDDHLRIDRALWFLAGQNLFVNRDSYFESGHNYYIYNDLSEGRFSTIPWDLNEAFGNFGMGLNSSQLQVISPLENYGNGDYPLITRLLNPTAGVRGRSAYFAHYREMLEKSWSWDVIGALVTQYQGLIETDVINDPKRLYSLQYFYDNVTQDVTIGTGGPGGRVSCGLKPFVENRRNYLTGLPELNSSRPEFSNIVTLPANPSPQDTVAVTARILAPNSSVAGAQLLWRAGKSGPYNTSVMYDDGAHGDGAANDGKWGGLIPPQILGTKIRWYMLAWTPSDNATHYPWQAEENPNSYKILPIINPNGILINEFLAKNDTGVTDEASEKEDWIEIINNTSATADLSAWYLSDDLQAPTQWSFPAGTVIPAGETILVWADNDTTQGLLHANFKLDKGGEELALIDADGTTYRDYFDFSDQESDISTGRLFDGDEQWATFRSPTPNDSNEQASGYREYDQLDPTGSGLRLEGGGIPSNGGTVNLKVSGANPGDTVILFVSRSSNYTEGLTNAGVVLIATNQIVLQRTLSVNPSGDALLSAPITNPSLIGVSFFAQSYLPSSSLGQQISNALEIIIAP